MREVASLRLLWGAKRTTSRRTYSTRTIVTTKALNGETISGKQVAKQVAREGVEPSQCSTNDRRLE